jgi:hypothetical protein
MPFFDSTTSVILISALVHLEFCFIFKFPEVYEFNDTTFTGDNVIVESGADDTASFLLIVI